MVDSAPSPSPSEYLENFVSNTLARQAQPRPITPVTPDRHMLIPAPTPNGTVAPGDIQSRSGQSTPGLTKAMARTALTPEESPDPLSMVGPSPTKRRKGLSKRSSSPTLRTLHSLPSPENAWPDIDANGGKSMGMMTPRKHGKGRMMIEVEIPIRSPSKSVATSTADDSESEEDELDWGARDDAEIDGDWEMGGRKYKSQSPGVDGPPVPPGSGRTGERDMRSRYFALHWFFALLIESTAHFQKLQSLLDDIFEESDSLPAEPTSEDLSSARYFSSLSKDGGRPLLSDNTLDKISRYVSRVQNGKQKHGVIGGKRSVIEWDTEMVGRLLNLLEANMVQGDGLVVFPNDKKNATAEKAKKGKGAKGKAAKSKSLSASAKDQEEASEKEEAGYGNPEEKVHQGEYRLATLRSAGLAAECCLVIMDTEGLSKQASKIIRLHGLVLNTHSSYLKTSFQLPLAWSRTKWPTSSFQWWRL